MGRAGSCFARYMALQWKHEHRLAFVATPTWLGWFCERCCWHITLDTEPTQPKRDLKVESQFEAHDCEEYAQQNWTGIK